MLGEDQVLERLRSALAPSGADAIASGADAIEGYVSASTTGHTRLANAEVIQDSLVHDATVIVRALVDGRLGVVSSNDLTTEGLARARKSAVEIARSGAGKPFPNGFLADASTVDPIPDAFDEQTANLTPDQRLARLSTPIDKARKAGLLLAGNYHSGSYETAVWNSEGLSRYHKNSRAEVNLIALEGLDPGMATGYAGDLSTHVDVLDFAALSETAIEKALIGRKPVELPPGKYDVILEPPAVAELLEWLGYIGFSSRSVEEKTSFTSNHLNEQVTGEAVSLVDDGRNSDGLPIPFDAEGTRKERMVLIENGVVKNYVYDRDTAQRLGCASTGHAVHGEIVAETGALPTNLFMAGGDGSKASLLSSVDRGLWITRLHYVNGMIEPRRAVMTGLTRDGTFLVENGKLARGVRTLRFTDSVLEAFGRIEGLSADRQTVPTWWSDSGAITAPTLLIRGLRFTS